MRDPKLCSLRGSPQRGGVACPEMATTLQPIYLWHRNWALRLPGLYSIFTVHCQHSCIVPAEAPHPCQIRHANTCKMGAGALPSDPYSLASPPKPHRRCKLAQPQSSHCTIHSTQQPLMPPSMDDAWPGIQALTAPSCCGVMHVGCVCQVICHSVNAAMSMDFCCLGFVFLGRGGGVGVQLVRIRVGRLLPPPVKPVAFVFLGSTTNPRDTGQRELAFAETGHPWSPTPAAARRPWKATMQSVVPLSRP